MKRLPKFNQMINEAVDKHPELTNIKVDMSDADPKGWDWFEIAGEHAASEIRYVAKHMKRAKDIMSSKKLSMWMNRYWVSIGKPAIEDASFGVHNDYDPGVFYITAEVKFADVSVEDSGVIKIQGMDVPYIVSPTNIGGPGTILNFDIQSAIY